MLYIFCYLNLQGCTHGNQYCTSYIGWSVEYRAASVFIIEWHTVKLRVLCWLQTHQGAWSHSLSFNIHCQAHLILKYIIFSTNKLFPFPENKPSWKESSHKSPLNALISTGLIVGIWWYMCKYKFQGSLCKLGSLLPGRKSKDFYLYLLIRSFWKVGLLT